jgi:hypothetical protein
MIGDIVAGPINVLPIGNFIVDSPIKGVRYLLSETLVFVSMAIVVIAKYYSFKRRRYILVPISLQDRPNSISSFDLSLVKAFFYLLVKLEVSLVEASIAVAFAIGGNICNYIDMESNKVGRSLVSKSPMYSFSSQTYQ